jgi:peptide/nickel transport system permease protein
LSGDWQAIGRLVARRLAILPIILFGVSIVLFVLSHVLPVDPAKMLLGEGITPEAYAARRHQLGLDRSYFTQYWIYIRDLFQGDLGVSTRYYQPVAHLVGQAVPVTAEIVLLGLLFAVVLGFASGIVSGYWSGTWVDGFARAVSLSGVSTPSYYLAILLIVVFGYYLGWLPLSGRGDGWLDVSHMVLPAAALGLRYAGSTTRLVRGSLIEALRTDYVRTARAFGAPEFSIGMKYALRNAMVPAVTSLGVQLAHVAGDVVLVETVFALPGIGRLALVAVQEGDFPLLEGTILALTGFSIAVNLVMDILQSIIDPRLRSTRRRRRGLRVRVASEASSS